MAKNAFFPFEMANFRFFAFSNISLVGILLASAISSFYLFDRFFSHSKGMTKNISRVHFCVNVKRNRSRMKPRNPASKNLEAIPKSTRWRGDLGMAP